MERCIKILKTEIIPALGCTEPAAVGLAVAKAVETLGCLPEQIRVLVSRNIFKNSMGVGIPGTGMVGLEIAVALAAHVGRSAYGLEVLRDANPSAIAQACQYLTEGRVQIGIKETPHTLYAEAFCQAGCETALVVIDTYHSNITRVQKNDSVLMQKDNGPAQTGWAPGHSLNMKEIFEFVEQVPADRLDFLDVGIEMNLRIAQEGLDKAYGLNVGKSMLKLQDGNEASVYAAALTAAAADARMAGCTLPVMSTAGSGNQGLTATLPVIALARHLDISRDRLRKAIAMSDLTTIHIKQHIGKLSALCGCSIAASIGASSAITWLLGGGYAQICYAVKNMIADISGLICDGAKAGCALKIATSVSGAYQCAALALNQMQAGEMDGIVSADVEESIRNLGSLGNRGMLVTDAVILEIMLCNQTIKA